MEKNKNAHGECVPVVRTSWLSLFWVLGVLVIASEPARAAIAYVQGNSTTSAFPQSSVVVNYSSSQTAGNLNVVIVGWEDSTSNVSSVTDSRGNSYTLAVGPTRLTGLTSQSIYYAKNIAAGSNSVTVTFNAAAPYPDVRVAEYSGIDTVSPFDGASSGTGTSGTALSTGSVTTTVANAVLVSGNMLELCTFDPGVNYTERIFTPHLHILQDRIVSSVGSYNATATLSGSGWWLIQVAAFKAASSGGGDTEAPTIPTSPSASAISSSQIDLGWSASTDNVAVTGYRVERCEGVSCSNFAEVGAPSGTAFSDTGLSPATTYRYRIRARDAVPNFSGYSTIVSATTPSTAAIAYVQGNATTSGSPQSSVVANFSTAQAAGNLNVVIVGWEDSTSNVSSVTDSRGNNYTLAIGPTRSNGNASQSIYYAKNIAAGANSVTVSFSSAVPFPDVRVAEYSGLDTVNPFDGAASGIAASGTALATSSLSTTAANVVLVAGNMVAFSTTGPGASYTQRILTAHSHLLEDRIVSATGSYMGTATQSQSGWWLIQVAAFKAAGSGGGDTQAPTTPGTPSVSIVSSSQIDLSWTASTDNIAVTGYRVERCQGVSCSNFSEVGTPSGTTFNDTGLAPSITYRYRVRAQDAVPNFSSYSGIVSGTTQSDTQAPTAPSGLNPTVSSTQINLSWTASTDNVAVTGYRVERCQGSSCSNFAEVGTPSGTTFDDTTGLSPSTTYRYRVRAQDAVPNFSGYSGIVNATTQAPADSQAPTAPSGLMVIASSSTEIDLVWGASTDNVAVTAYLVERCQGPGCSNFTQVGSTPLTRFDDPNRTPATTYRYRVRAQDAVPNFSPYSNVISIVTPASSPDCD